MARTTTRRWKGCQLCKPHKHASNSDGHPMTANAARQFGTRKRVSRKQVPNEWNELPECPMSSRGAVDPRGPAPWALLLRFGVCTATQPAKDGREASQSIGNPG